MRSFLTGAVVIALVSAPLMAASFSPLLAWRDPIYIAASFAGIIALALLLLQPILAMGFMPGITVLRGRRLHRWIGVLLVASVIAHVGGLWITSPPDVIDALSFASPTQFSVWGVVAMWAVFAAALLALLRHRLRPRTWRMVHSVLALVIVIGTCVHALLIEGAMETVSKVILCAAVIVVTAKALSHVKLRAKRSPSSRFQA